MWLPCMNCNFKSYSLFRKTVLFASSSYFTFLVIYIYGMLKIFDNFCDKLHAYLFVFIHIYSENRGVTSGGWIILTIYIYIHSFHPWQWNDTCINQCVDQLRDVCLILDWKLINKSLLYFSDQLSKPYFSQVWLHENPY